MKQFDLSLPSWGPYNKRYLGAGNVADKEKGISFNFNIFPGFYRRSVLLPRDICDSGTKIMKSSSDLSHFLYRYELMWKDKVYIDGDYCEDNNGDMTVTLKIVNNSEDSQSISVNGCAALKFPTFLRKDLEIYEVKGDGLWIDAIDYSFIKNQETIAQEGFRKGERRVSTLVGGSGLLLKTFKEGDFVEYSFEKTSFDEISLRYKGSEKFKLTFEINGEKTEKEFEPLKNVENVTVKIKGEADSIKIYPECKDAFIDGLIIGKNNIEFEKYTDDFIPEIKKEDKKVTLKYSCGEYEISWDYDNYVIRELVGNDMGNILTDFIHNHVDETLYGEGKGHALDIFIRPVFLAANSEKTITFKIRRIDKKIIEKNDNTFARINVNSDGESFSFSQDIMTANTLTNVVFPTFIRGEYIRHNTPGRLWDCLYTWDSGFIGIGLNAINEERAVECLNNYLTELGDSHSPFIFRGSCVPTQIFLFQEIWNKKQDINFLKKFYPFMKQYYEYFSNIIEKETGLSKTWELFYNSGGWDDYPPQKYVHNNNMASYTYPVITASMTILFAKIMKSFAAKLGESTELYNKDIERISKSILTNCWDEESGYFGYICYENGNINILKYNNEVNFNMGFDGIYPYIADICDENQNKRIFANLKDGLMTKYGVSVVDTRAPYYSKEGYWNGSVWMPHQWVIWKSLFDRGEWETATEIAKTALEVWKNEVELTYNCYEHFMIENGRGAGFHQFSGLSTPVLSWYRAYYSPGAVTTGFFTFVSDAKWNDDYSSFECRVESEREDSSIMVCMNEKYSYKISIDGKPAAFEKATNGAYIIKNCNGDVVITAIYNQ